MKKTIVRIIPLLLVLALLAGCASDPASSSSTDGAESSTTSSSSIDVLSTEPSMDDDLKNIPEWSGNPYIEMNGGTPYFSMTGLTSWSFESYSELDTFGRAGAAIACVGIGTIPTEERGSIGSVKPSGWHTVRYNGLVDGNYLYNRCHLIGYQLAGENANERNLITGTRYLNIEGMLPFENKVLDYVESTGNHVLYRVTPIFEGYNLLANGVLMEASSIEDEGDGLQFCVYCYNVQPGITIYYDDGDSELEDSATATDGSESDVSSQAETTFKEDLVQENTFSEWSDEQQGKESSGTTGWVHHYESSDEASGTTYILNTNSKKFHYPSCASVDQMKESNKKEYTGTREDVIAMGYSPCGRCHP